jgi:hypothetical protein
VVASRRNDSPFSGSAGMLRGFDPAASISGTSRRCRPPAPVREDWDPPRS